MSKLFSFYRTVLFSAIIIYLVIAVLPIIIGFKPYIILSGSMEPEIQTGSLCFLEGDTSNLQIGDVVGYRLNKDVTVVHRIIDFTEDGGVLTKGDNNDSADIATINRDQIVGTVKWSVPQVGYLTKWMQTKQGIIVCAVFAVVAFLSSFFTDTAEARSRKKALVEEVETEETVVSEIQTEPAETVESSQIVPNEPELTPEKTDNSNSTGLQT